MLKHLSGPLKYTIVLLEILLLLTVLLLFYNFTPIGKERISPIYFDNIETKAVLKTLKSYGFAVADWELFWLPKKLLPQKGWYRIMHQDAGRYIFFTQLASTPAETMRIKVFAGETYVEICRRIANDMRLDASLLEAVYREKTRFQEGDILSGLYHIAKDADENATIAFLFEASTKRLADFTQKNFPHTPDTYTMKLLLIVASIIQKESNNPKEMPLIASVIFNRLERGMKLQMDGTLNYGKYSHQIVTPERIKNDTSYYNTYKYKGLPPAPLASVSLQALNAATFPAKSEYLFFMLNPNGKHRFAKTYREHLVNLKVFREYQKVRKSCSEENNITQCISKKLSKKHLYSIPD